MAGATGSEPGCRDWCAGPGGCSSRSGRARTMRLPTTSTAAIFGERIPVLEHVRERLDPTSIGSAYVRLANLMRTRLDWKASFGGVATQVAQQELALGIERTESQKLRSEKEALQALILKSRRRAYKGIAAAFFGFLLVSSLVEFGWMQQREAFRQRDIAEQVRAALERTRATQEDPYAQLQYAQSTVRVLRFGGEPVLQFTKPRLRQMDKLSQLFKGMESVCGMRPREQN
jgi:hypothetical protein